MTKSRRKVRTYRWLRHGRRIPKGWKRVATEPSHHDLWSILIEKI